MLEKLQAWHRSTFGLTLCGAAILWLALPPYNLWLLAWIAPAWWLVIVRRRELDGKRPYLKLWLAGFAFWLAAYYWLTLPYWATCLGWIALAFYLAFYLPLFIGLSRVAVHRLRVPLMVAAPVVWTGLELARGHLLTGITMASLGHTQYRWIELIQLSDFAGAYGVSFVVMFAAACLTQMLPLEGKPRVFWPLTPAGALIAAALAYGYFRCSQAPAVPEDAARIALIQGSIDTEMKSDPNMVGIVFDHYRKLTDEAKSKFQPLDLIVWPETMYRYPLVSAEPNAKKPKFFQVSDDKFREYLAEAPRESLKGIQQTVANFDVPMILGIEAMHFGLQQAKCFNTAIFVDSKGNILGRYDKMHPVMFGEYVPFVRYFPWLQDWMPMDMSLTAGQHPAAFVLKTPRMGKSLCLSPNICYENVLPQVIRRQVLELRAEGKEPDALVSLTNDGWFWGSAELDMHLICAVFRAVECRKPFLIAANTGFSASINSSGKIVVQGKRRKPDVLLGQVAPDGRESAYLALGDAFAGVCLAACAGLALVGLAARFRPRGRSVVGDCKA